MLTRRLFFPGIRNGIAHGSPLLLGKEVMPGDDVFLVKDYRPQEAGGSLHLINVTVNQTVDFNSQCGSSRYDLGSSHSRRDRQPHSGKRCHPNPMGT